MPDSPTSFPMAYVRFLPPVRAKCRRLLGSSAEAEEVAQDAFLRLWQSGFAGIELPPDADARPIMGWLYRTCTRLAIDALRKRRRTVANHDGEDASERVPCGVGVERAIAAKKIMTALHARVPGEELEAAILCRVDGLSHAETAEVLEVSERTVRRLLEAFDVHAESWRKEFAS
ncbi:RNA polymerase sigma factor [Pendulispora rubella]|uniref:RNA polymerase sigma factor n=1 Tax=Pendulispora rubella TaxID=2741070 RepID=A0ABZ2L961_9BACT